MNTKSFLFITATTCSAIAFGTGYNRAGFYAGISAGGGYNSGNFKANMVAYYNPIRNYDTKKIVQFADGIKTLEFLLAI